MREGECEGTLKKAQVVVIEPQMFPSYCSNYRTSMKTRPYVALQMWTQHLQSQVLDDPDYTSEVITLCDR